MQGIGVLWVSLPRLNEFLRNSIRPSKQNNQIIEKKVANKMASKAMGTETIFTDYR